MIKTWDKNTIIDFIQILRCRISKPMVGSHHAKVVAFLKHQAVNRGYSWKNSWMFTQSKVFDNTHY